MSHLNNDQQVEFQTEATRFLELLGKDPDKTWIRCLRQHEEQTGTGADTQHLKLKANASAFFVTGNGDPANGRNLEDSDITSCPALFVEWDDGASIEEQLQRWQALELPEPSVMVATGGKSVHCYWVLQEPISAAEWKRITARLIAHCNSDKQCSNPSRVMRLPGSVYYDKKTGKATGQCRILSSAGTRYSAAEVEACLPEPKPAKPVAAPLSRDWEPRSIEEINAAAEYIPRRVGHEGTYEADRNALCGCSAALAQAGVDDPDDAALGLLGHLWADAGIGKARQVLDSCTTRNAASFWAIAVSHGYILKAGKIKTKEKQIPNTFIDLIKELDDGWSSKGAISGLSPGHLKDLIPSGSLSFNEMDHRAYINTLNGREMITEADLDSAFVVLSSKGWRIGIDPLTKTVLHVARQQTFHPLREYLEMIETDPSIEDFDLNFVAPKFFRASDPMHSEMVRKWLIGAVKRVFEPGCQMDGVLVLQSNKQGIGKTTLMRILASPTLFCSTMPSDEKDFLLNIHSTWIFELAELETLTSRKSTGHLKNLITTNSDLVRMPYGRVPEPMKRASVFCATVNHRNFLRDETGNRRFWVIPIHGEEKLDRAGLTNARDAIWKAAVLAYRMGEVPMLSDDFANKSEEQNFNYQEHDPWIPLINKFLNDRRESKSLPVTSGALLQNLGIPEERHSPRESRRVRAIAESLGWEFARRRVDQKRVQGLWPPVDSHATHPATHPDPPDSSGSPSLVTHTTHKSENHVKEEKGTPLHPYVVTMGARKDLCVAYVDTPSKASDTRGYEDTCMYGRMCGTDGQDSPHKKFSDAEIMSIRHKAEEFWATQPLRHDPGAGQKETPVARTKEDA